MESVAIKTNSRTNGKTFIKTFIAGSICTKNKINVLISYILDSAIFLELCGFKSKSRSRRTNNLNFFFSYSREESRLGTSGIKNNWINWSFFRNNNLCTLAVRNRKFDYKISTNFFNSGIKSAMNVNCFAIVIAGWGTIRAS